MSNTNGATNYKHTHFDVRLEALILKKVALDSLATAFA